MVVESKEGVGEGVRGPGAGQAVYGGSGRVILQLAHFPCGLRREKSVSSGLETGTDYTPRVPLARRCLA